MDEHVLDDLAAYLDDEVAGDRRAVITAHLSDCEGCRRELALVARGRQAMRALGSEAMPEPRAQRLRDAVVGHAPLAAADRRPDGSPPAPAAARRWRLLAAAAVWLVVGASVAGYWQINRPWIRLEWPDDAATPFEDAGRQLHDDLLAGRTTVDVRSSDARVLWAWLARQGAPVTAPVRTGADPARFVPVGAAVRSLAGARVSVLAYRVDGRPVTLALADRATVADHPEAGWWSKRVQHRWSPTRRHSLTWTIGSGTYVMVAEVDGDGLTACLICHDDARFVRRVTPAGAPRQ